MRTGTIQVITATERKRRYTLADKQRLLAEAAATSMAAVGRRHGVASSVLYM